MAHLALPSTLALNSLEGSFERRAFQKGQLDDVLVGLFSQYDAVVLSTDDAKVLKVCTEVYR